MFAHAKCLPRYVNSSILIKRSSLNTAFFKSYLCTTLTHNVCLFNPVTGRVPSQRRALWFTQKPNEILYFHTGGDAVLKWSYSASNKSADLKFIIWCVYNKTDRQYYPLVVEYLNGAVQLNPLILSDYVGRVEKADQATLVIKNVSSHDSTWFKCTLRGNQGVSDESSTVQLVVTGTVCLVQYNFRKP